MKKQQKRRWNQYTPRFDKSRKRWILQWPMGGTTKSGKPRLKTKTFATKQDAEVEAAKLKEAFRQSGRIGNQLNASSSSEESISTSGGILLKDAINRNLDGLRLACKIRKGGSLKNSGYTLNDLHFANQSENTIEDKTAPSLNSLAEDLGELPLKDVSLDHLNEHLSNLDVALATLNTRVNIYKRFFLWCIDSPQKYIKMSPASGLKTLKCEWAKPKFYEVSDIEKLFRTAEIEDPGIIVDLALRFFAGIRSAEIAKMKTSDIWWDEFSINIRAEVAKGRSPIKRLPRLIENLPDTAWEWLLAVGGEKLTKDLSNRTKRISHIHNVAGVKAIRNGGRKSFATYAYAFEDEGAGKVCKWTGHRQEKTFHDYYRGLVRKQMAERYFKILPSKNDLCGDGKRKRRHQRKIDWPPVEEVSKLVRNQGYSGTGRMLGVSDNAVRKYLKNG